MAGKKGQKKRFWSDEEKVSFCLQTWVADPALEVFFAASGAQIDVTEEPRAYYNIKTDRIRMAPIATFHRAAGYYGTLPHELTHWTGAPKRLDRLGRFNDRKAYAFEELVAEIGNCMLCAQIGVEPEFDQSAAYVEGWFEAMKEDTFDIPVISR